MNFLKNNKRFSFKLGEKNAWELEFKTESKCSENELITVYTFKDGLKITNIAKKYNEFGAYEWVNYFENTSNMPSDIISELWDCDVELPFAHEDDRKWGAYFPEKETATKVYNPGGSTNCIKDFCCESIDAIQDNFFRINHIETQQIKKYSASGGRSSEAKAPFFNIHKNGNGCFFAIGWSGQWNAEIKRDNDSITFKSKIEDTYFRLLPGEKIKTSSIVIMPYKAELSESHNLWRRFIKDNFSLIGKQGRDKFAPLCASIWGGMRSSSIIERIEKIKQNNLPYEYIWIDAGWYGENTKPTPNEFEGDWWAHTGDWTVSPDIHPNGLKDVSELIHKYGMKMILWFEVERIIKTTPIATEHPEYLLKVNEEETNLLLNLGNEKAWNYCFQTLAGFIEKLNVDCYRCDFNISPLNFWRHNDAEERIGITEIKYINGLYKLWDALLNKFPHLMIDNCASGGRRIDIETMRRSFPLWRSDCTCPANYDPEIMQCHNQSYNLWLSHSGAGTGRIYDEYRIRSAYSASLSMQYFYAENENFCDTPEKIEFLKKYMTEYLELRSLYSEDFYNLTDFSENTDVWCAMQDRKSVV